MSGEDVPDPDGHRPLHDRALQASVDMADLAHEPAVPRDWWLRAMAMELAIRKPIAGAYGDDYLQKQAQRFEHYIRNGELPA